jgi:hypothetical protein
MPMLSERREPTWSKSFSALPSLEHCAELLGDHGIVQFARARKADRDSGFCLDDNARALLVSIAYDRLDGKDSTAASMGSAALQFFSDASAEAPCYHNTMDRYGRFTDDSASPESIGRMIWALGVAATCAGDATWRDAAWRRLETMPHAVGALTTPHARAFAMLGLAALVRPDVAAPVPPAVDGDAKSHDEITTWACHTLYAMAAAMQFEYERNASPDWMWWESRLTYDNARLPEAMLRAALALGEPKFGNVGMAALRFLTSVTQPHGMFVPIGAPRWYERGAARPLFDQQPLEASAMVDANLAAFSFTGNTRFVDEAIVAYEWFFGRNVAGIVVADAGCGGCHDGITPNGPNPNMGAESTLAHVQATLFLNASAGG